MNGHELENYAQVISLEMMEGLKNSAHTHGITLEMEVTLRLLANAGTETSEGGRLYNTIVQRKFTTEEAIAECQRKREAAVYRYEIEKLTLLLGLEDILPRKIKDTFTVIDVKAESPKIREEIKRRRAAAGEDGDETMPIFGGPTQSGGNPPSPKGKPGGKNPNGNNNPNNDDEGDDGELV